MGKDLGYTVIHRGVMIPHVEPGRWTFIQRAKEYGGGWWFGRVYDDCFMLEFERPSSLSEGIRYILSYERMNQMPSFDDDFKLD
ncbi:lF-82 [Superficieibacter electus]|uniref:LF-82 n=1 Tax=Superficieibacter electus TaxID=2022662 RepID=A0A2P5GVG9_9ENTR|nr:lF-82 [Superficieibacter electus]POP42352.1 lF-82 [Superficieibacter electus]POP50541.1 lF-82 [Superficieibacter electus]